MDKSNDKWDGSYADRKADSQEREAMSYDYVNFKPQEGESTLETEVRGIRQLSAWWKEKGFSSTGTYVMGGRKGSAHVILWSDGFAEEISAANLERVESAGIDYADWNDRTWSEWYHSNHAIKIIPIAGEEFPEAHAQFFKDLQSFLESRNLQNLVYVRQTGTLSRDDGPVFDVFTSEEIAAQIVQAKLPRFESISSSVPLYIKPQQPDY